MVLDAETVVERRRLKRRLTVWRILAIVLGLLFVGALLLGDKNFASSAGILPHIARVTVSGVITNDRKMNELIEKIGLADRRKHRPSELSGGQQQRVAIGRALVSRPSIVFADEPTGNLDSKTSGEILELLERSVQELEQTIVMVTHESRAAAIADRVLFLADGVIVRESKDISAQDIVAAMDELGGS